MKESELKQFLYEHPELLDDAFQTSLTEADRWAKEHPRSAAELIRRAKAAHPEIAAEAWTDFEKAAAKHDQTKQPKEGKILHIRWWQIAVAAAIIIVLTFTLVPPARAWAESVIQYIVHIFDGGIDITPEGKSFMHGTPTPEELIPPPPSGIDTEMEYHTKVYPDINAFIEDTGYHPVVVKSSDLSIKSIEFEWLEDAYEELRITYESQDSVLIYAWQIWGNERGGTIYKDEHDELIHTTVLDGREAVGYINTVDHRFAIEVLLERSDLTILYHGEFDYQTVLDALQYS